MLQKITKLSKEISRNIKQDRSCRRIKCMMHHINKTGGINKALKELREETLWIPKIKDNKNKHETKRQPILELATEYYQKLYSSENIHEMNADFEGDAEEIPQILEREVQNAIMSQKNEKAPGTDNITNEMMKARLPETIKRLTNLFNLILDTENIPIQWTTSSIILIHKKGDRAEI